MFFTNAILLSIGFTSVLAAPMRYTRLEDLQCRCLTFSTSAAPTLCTYQELLTLDWETAYSLASANRLKIQFASEKTTTKVLSLPRPVPTSILETLQEGEARPLDPSKKVQHENRVICGFGDEVEHVNGRPGKSLTPEIHYVGTVLGLFMLLLIIYLIGEFAARARSVRLEGDEKTLSADFEASTPTPSEKSEHAACTAPMESP